MVEGKGDGAEGHGWARSERKRVRVQGTNFAFFKSRVQILYTVYFSLYYTILFTLLHTTYSIQVLYTILGTILDTTQY